MAAWMLGSKGDFKGAIDAYSAALSLAPNDKGALRERSIAYWAVGDTLAAARDVIRNCMLNLRPIDVGFLHTCYDQCCKALAEVHSESSAAFDINWGRIYLATFANRWTEAYEFSKGLPSISERVLENVGLYGKAEEALLADKSLDSNVGGLRCLADTYRRMGNFAAAKRYLDKAVALTPDEVAPYKEQADLCILSGDLRGAAAYADTLEALNSAYASFFRMRVFLQRGEWTAAHNQASEYAKNWDGSDSYYRSDYIPGEALFAYVMADDTLSFARGVDSARKYGDCNDWFYIAQAYAMSADEEAAIEAISTAFDRGFCSFVLIEKSPEFDVLRFNDEFNDLIRRKQEEQTSRLEKLLND